LSSKRPDADERLLEALRRFHKLRRESHAAVAPPTAYCMVTREKVESLEEEFEDIKKMLRGIWVSVLLILVGLIIDIVIVRTGVLGGV